MLPTTGADDYISLNNAAEVAAAARCFDLVLDTSPASSLPDTYLHMLKFGA